MQGEDQIEQTLEVRNAMLDVAEALKFLWLDLSALGDTFEGTHPDIRTATGLVRDMREWIETAQTVLRPLFNEAEAEDSRQLNQLPDR